MKSTAGWSSYLQIPPICDDSGLVLVYAKDRAKALNDLLGNASATHPTSLPTFSSFSFQPITEESTFKAL